jgi:hypothetical protein
MQDMDKDEARERYIATCREIENTKIYLKEMHTNEEMHHLDQELRARKINFCEGFLTDLEAQRIECVRVLSGK